MFLNALLNVERKSCGSMTNLIDCWLALPMSGNCSSKKQTALPNYKQSNIKSMQEIVTKMTKTKKQTVSQSALVIFPTQSTVRLVSTSALSITGTITTNINLDSSLHTPAFMTLLPLMSKRKAPEARREEVVITLGWVFLLIWKK